ncbi:DUF3332 domain-containing protein [Maribacter sp. 2307ULW6-5]|uniref:DUF3332 domain-containing protein n=1 Tax=Maribacter sp. 2307ULW6-5 TaxID=3386275 RepID=UPI0039BCACEF
MKKSVICIALSSSLLFSSCLGSFNAFNNLKDWNQEVSDSKFVNNLIFWGLNIVPVYGLFFLGDAIIFNVIEFWGGSNPIAMAPGEREVQLVEHEGNTIRMEATKNRMYLEVVQGPKKGSSLDMMYWPESQSWNAVKDNGDVIKLSSFEQGMFLVHLPNGEVVEIDPLLSRQEGLAQLRQDAQDRYLYGMVASQ